MDFHVYPCSMLSCRAQDLITDPNIVDVSKYPLFISYFIVIVPKLFAVFLGPSVWACSSHFISFLSLAASRKSVLYGNSSIKKRKPALSFESLSITFRAMNLLSCFEPFCYSKQSEIFWRILRLMSSKSLSLHL